MPQYSPREELANSITHGVGVLLAIGALAILTAFATLFGDAWHIVGCSIFGATLIILYTASTLYHPCGCLKYSTYKNSVFRVQQTVFLISFTGE